MTTLRATFLPPQAPMLAWLLLTVFQGAALSAPAGARPPQEARVKDPRLVRVPSFRGPVAWSSTAFLDGRHLTDSSGESQEGATGLGDLLPLRTIVSMVEKEIDAATGSTSGITVDALGSSLVIRGGTLGAEGTQRQARQVARETMEVLAATLAPMHFDLGVTLTAGRADSEDETAVLADSRSVWAGDRIAFGARGGKGYVSDFDVEVAAAVAIADPVIRVVGYGETLHLWTSSVVGSDGTRRLFVQGLLDIAHELPAERFDPDIYELGTVDLPIIDSVQIMFAGTLDFGEPLVVEVEGLAFPGRLETSRRLSISAQPMWLNESSPPPGPDRVVDLGRGIWRSSLEIPHALNRAEPDSRQPVAQRPAGAAQLLNGLTRSPVARPDLGSFIMIFADAAEASEARELFQELDPIGPEARLTVGSVGGDFKASVPASPGARLRVARTRETFRLVDYSPQIANDASLADPVVEESVTGSVVEGVLRLDEAGAFVDGTFDTSVETAVEVRESDSGGVGRLQLPRILRRAAPFSVRLGETQELSKGVTVGLSDS